MNTINTPQNQKTGLATLHLWLLALITIGLPLLFDPWCMDTFSLPKLTLLRLIVIAIIGGCIFEMLDSGVITRRGGRPGLFLIVFMAVLIAATVFSVAPRVALVGVYGFRIDGLLTWACFLVLFAFGTEQHTTQRLETIGLYLAVGGLLVSLYALVQYAGFDPLKWGLDPTHARIWSSFGNPNFLAAYIAMILPFNLALLFTAKTSGKRVLAGGGLALALWVLAQALSRAAWLGAGLGVIVLLALGVPWRNVRVKYLLAGVLAGIVLLAVFAPWSRVAERVSTGTRLSSPEWILRFAGWKTALGLAKEKPLIGHGAEGYHLNFRRHMDSSFFRITHQTQISPLLPHNEFLQILVTAGGLGLLAYLLFLGSLFLGALRRRGDVWIAALPAAMVASLANNLFSFHTIATAALFFFLCGVLAGSLAQPKTTELPAGNAKWLLLLLFIPAALWGSWLSLRVYKADHLFKEAARADEQGFIQMSLKKYQLAFATNKAEPHYLHGFAEVGTRLADKSQNPQARRSWLEGTGRIYLSILKINPADALAHNGLGIIYGRLYRDYGASSAAEAEQEFKKATQLDPLMAEAWTNLGALYNKEGRVDEARQAYASAKDANPYDPQIYYDIGVLNALSKNWDAAKRSWEEALEIDPNHEQSKQALALLEKENKGVKK